jgi:hypothetical protein
MARRGLRIYSQILGLAVSFFSFVWVLFQVYLVAQTPGDQHDLRMARYLDICFGLLAFFSSLALMYGAFVESKTWLSAWTLGSITVVVGMWVWYFYGKFHAPDHPEVVKDSEKAGIVLTVIYFGSTVPVWVFQNMIEYWDFRTMCTLDWLCPAIVLSFRRGQVQTRRNNGCQQQHAGRRRSAQPAGGSGPSYAQCTTSTFLAPAHVPVHHIPASKGD